ncbi:hypothetical protein SMICM304S_09085 [Streptomyces microflavus]
MTATDSLSVWLRVRRETDWHRAPALQRIPTDHDGFRSWCEGPVRRRDPTRAGRLLAAHNSACEDAARRSPLDFALLSGWQREVLASPRAPFRVGDAYAKAGRERYGLTPRTQADFASCLHETPTRPSRWRPVPPAPTSTWRSSTRSLMAMPVPRC